MTLVDQNTEFAVLDIPSGPSTTDVVARTLQLRFSNVPLAAVSGSAHSIYSNFIADTTSDDSKSFGVAGVADSASIMRAKGIRRAEFLSRSCRRHSHRTARYQRDQLQSSDRYRWAPGSERASRIRHGIGRKYQRDPQHPPLITEASYAGLPRLSFLPSNVRPTKMFLALTLTHSGQQRECSYLQSLEHHDRYRRCLVLASLPKPADRGCLHPGSCTGSRTQHRRHSSSLPARRLGADRRRPALAGQLCARRCFSNHNLRQWRHYTHRVAWFGPQQDRSEHRHSPHHAYDESLVFLLLLVLTSLSREPRLASDNYSARGHRQNRHRCRKLCARKSFYSFAEPAERSGNGHLSERQLQYRRD